MGFGNYDEEEHEKREERLVIETTEETLAGQHEGEVTTEGGDDTNALLDQLKTIKDTNEEDEDNQ